MGGRGCRTGTCIGVSNSRSESIGWDLGILIVCWCKIPFSLIAFVHTQRNVFSAQAAYPNLPSISLLLPVRCIRSLVRPS
jgi:hypothetical protein